MSPIEEVIINKKSNINPIWIMRQAGRYLPEFREIRKQNPDFIKLCLNEKLSSEITLQPLKRFNLDAAIIFSDILLLPYGLGQKVEFQKNFGPKLGDLNLNEIQDLEREITLFNAKVIKETTADIFTDTASGSTREERIVVVPNPTTSDADDDFGFTTTLSFFADGKRYNPSSDSDT